MPGAFLVPLDIANRACDHVGATYIASFTEDSKPAQRLSFLYDKLRVAELRRNVWRAAIRKVALRAVDDTSMFLLPAAYNAADVYPQGSLVTLNSLTYISRQAVPINTPPGNPNEAFWWVYFGPLTATPWVPEGSSTSIPTITYYAGELVYNVVGTTVNVYQCLTTGTTDDPTAAPAAWDPTLTYWVGDTVTSGAAVWQSLIDLNTDNVPAAGPLWQLVPADQPSTQVGQNWLQLNATLIHKRIQYPIGSGPRDQATTRNVFRLPSGYLREAPQQPKAGSISYLGAPSGLPEDDWEFEADFIISRDNTIIIFRFVADVQDVSDMDPMFCEGLGARLGFEACEALTQSTEKQSICAQTYKMVMGEARAVNGIETGPTEPPVDDYIATRL